MYLLVNAEQLKKRSSMYETMPDGRSIVPLSDQRILGTLKGVDIISTARELKQLIEEQKKEMENTDADIDPGFSVIPGTDTEVDPDFSVIPEGDGTTGDGTTNDNEDTVGDVENQGSETETATDKEEEVTDGQTEQ